MASKLTKRPVITTPPLKQDDARLEEFIGGAPDASTGGAKEKPTKREGRKQISHTLPPALLDKVDEKADSMGLTRAGLINLALSEFLNR